MAKQTFINLPADKQRTFIDAALKEFTHRDYDHASISSILKELGMAKGSFYQYFDNKKALFLYLVQLLSQKKLEYVSHVIREDYDDFWAYWKAMYVEGMKFDREEARLSHFGYRLFETMNSPTMKPMLVASQQQGLEHIKTMILPEIEAGKFRNDIQLDRMAFFIINSSREMIQLLMLQNHDEFEQCITEGQPIFAGKNEKLLFEALEDFIRLLQSAINVK